MFRRMAAAGDHGPVMAAKLDDLCVLKPAIGVGHLAHALPEPAKPLAVILDLVLAPAGRLVEVDPGLRRLSSCVGDQHTAGNVLQLAHPELRAGELTGQPARIADMVGVHMGDDHPPDRPNSFGVANLPATALSTTHIACDDTYDSPRSGL